MSISSNFLGKYQSKSWAECDDMLIGSGERRNYELLIYKSSVVSGLQTYRMNAGQKWRSQDQLSWV